MKPEEVMARLRERNLFWLVEESAKAHFVTERNICGQRRTRSLVAARGYVWKRIRETTLLTYVEIGEMWGFNHTTILYGVRKAHESGRNKVLDLPLKVG